MGWEVLRLSRLASSKRKRRTEKWQNDANPCGQGQEPMESIMRQLRLEVLFRVFNAIHIDELILLTTMPSHRLATSLR